ncbi:uncharacterized protein OCT59_026598 [Rhizophagus irregularis]|uniref:uncharacterized protein n=1 Tax=Rhizophagus irregularis TaxID=588596 RepID=UPI0033268C90|nr:hypothetical protein OCT59_026598 [Rhizophagus irregularis]
MSCSKILSGDLPELTYEIIKYFRDDYSTLHSCILVNRSWCRLAIPLLWENPFSICAENYNFVEIYIHNLNDDLKIKLNECKIIDNNSLHLNTLFNYPSFLKYLNIYNFVHSVNEWFKANTKHEDQLCSVFDFISMSLFGIFIENEVNLHTLEIEVQSSYDTYIDNIVEFILKNPNFILNIRNLKLYILLNYDNEHSSDRILQIVNLHQNLKKIILNNDYLSLLRSLLLSKDYNCSNTLNTIVFYEIDFNFLNYEIFEQLNVLESIHIIYCSLSNNFFHQIINLSKQFKLKSLFIREIPQIDSIELLLQTSGHYLRNFGHGDDMNIYPLFNFIENMKQSLDYLTIDISSFTYHPLKRYYSEASQIILQNLGQVLPPKLEYLCLDLFYVESNDFEVFLKNSQDTFINKLLIRKINSQDILPYIKEYYIMKNKRVKYLSIYDLSSVGSKRDIDLFSLKDEVKEFGLYNIKVQSYNSSVIYDHMRVID